MSDDMTGMAAPAVEREGPANVSIFVKVQPKARKAAIEAARDDGHGRMRLQVKVTAAPEDGKANAAVERLVAEALGIARNRVRVVQGVTDRAKRLGIEGEGFADAEDIAARARDLGT
jgi:uncharacterized protein YggU (UPF0235/DUF167 family)